MMILPDGVRPIFITFHRLSGKPGPPGAKKAVRQLPASHQPVTAATHTALFAATPGTCTRPNRTSLAPIPQRGINLAQSYIRDKFFVPFGFYIIMAAQFFSALADNALLIAAIAALREMQAPAEYEPLLKTFFTVSYVVLAAFVGAFADSMPKGRVMLISNTIKIVGCSMMFFGAHPLLAYAVVGLGAPATRRPSTAS
jgi:hypothetical protein